MSLILLAALSAGPPAFGKPELTFKDVRYLTRSLDDFPRAKAFALVFTTTSCPLVGRYLPALSRLEREYRARGVQFLSVNVGEDDTIADMAAHALEHGVAFPTVKDYEGRAARALGVRLTPTVVVLDESRSVRYRGRVDDQYRIGGARPKPTRSDLKEALDEVLAGKEVSVASTPVDGCPLPEPKRVHLRLGDAPRFAEDVAPILFRHCVECHRPGTAAPFSLLTYEQASSKAGAIAQVVRDGNMPPWYGAPKHDHFANHRGLTAKEKETVRLWAKYGRLRGDESKMPKPPPLAPQWRIGKPDLIVQAPTHDLPAEGVIAYKYVVLPHVFLADTWVQGVEIKPDNPRVLHHCNMAHIGVGGKFSIQNFITGTVPGGEAMTLTDGVGYKVPAGSVLVLQIHYVTTGKKERCRISVGFKFAQGRIDQHLRFHYIVDNRFAIPPGEPMHRVSASRVFAADSLGVGMFSHMHVRGRDMTFTAHYPSGKSEELLMIPNYSFDWQQAYRWKAGAKKFPKGTRVEVVAHYDNSAFNPFNPNPRVTVRHGEQTADEMMNGFLFYVEEAEKLGLEVDGKTGRALAKKK
jgi:hypothetical protein